MKKCDLEWVVNTKRRTLDEKEDEAMAKHRLLDDEACLAATVRRGPTRQSRASAVVGKSGSRKQ